MIDSGIELSYYCVLFRFDLKYIRNVTGIDTKLPKLNLVRKHPSIHQSSDVYLMVENLCVITLDSYVLRK